MVQGFPRFEMPHNHSHLKHSEQDDTQFENDKLEFLQNNIILYLVQIYRNKCCVPSLQLCLSTGPINFGGPLPLGSSGVDSFSQS